MLDRDTLEMCRSISSYCAHASELVEAAGKSCKKEKALGTMLLQISRQLETVTCWLDKAVVLSRDND